jgi:endo-1,4-beta-xylanase
VKSLPFDQHWLIALVAPRPLISAEGLSDQFCNGKASEASYFAALPVYKFLNAGDNLGINYRPGTHAFTLEDWQAVLDFADARLLGKQVSRRFDQFPPEELLK